VKRRIISACLVLVVVMISAMFLRPAREPQYRGKSLSEWLAECNEPRAFEARAAIQHIGTNALPWVAASIKAKDSKFTAEAVRLMQSQSVIGVHFTTARDRRNRAVTAVRVLGETAKPIIPALMESLNDGETATGAAEALATLGLEGLSAMTNIVQNKDPRTRAAVVRATTWVRTWEGAMTLIPLLVEYLHDKDADIRAGAAQALERLRDNPELVVPALIPLLKDPEYSPRWNASETLGWYGRDAKDSIPAMVDYVKTTGSRSERGHAIEALRKIDPEGAAQFEGD
jgi:HEAT repeat protein